MGVSARHLGGGDSLRTDEIGDHLVADALRHDAPPDLAAARLIYLTKCIAHRDDARRVPRRGVRCSGQTRAAKRRGSESIVANFGLWRAALAMSADTLFGIGDIHQSSSAALPT